MKILMLTTQLFALPMDGGALRSWHIVRQAAKRHEVTVLGMYAPGCEPSAEDLQRIGEVAQKVITVERPGGIGFKAGNAFKSLFTPQAYNLGNYFFPAFQSALHEVLRNGRFDVVHAHHPHTAQYHSALGAVATVYDAQNIYSELWRAYAETPGRGLIAREFGVRQAALVAKSEARAFEQFDVSAVCSDADRARALELAPNARVRTVPNGVDCVYFAPSDAAEEAFSLVFTGAMDVPVNVDACRYVVREILPRVVKDYGKTRLYLVGKNPAPAVQRLASEHVVVTGTVADVRPFQAHAQVVIAPLRGGSGTRLKILEAMAMGKAVVATTAAAEGIACTHGENVIIADTAETFAAEIRTLFADAARRRELGAAARKFVCAQYTWDAAEPQLDEMYAFAVERARGRA